MGNAQSGPSRAGLQTVLMAVDRVIRAVESQARLRGELRKNQPVIVSFAGVPDVAKEEELGPIWNESDFHDGTYQRWAAAHGDAEGARWRPGDSR